ncbi:hypothetical protein [Jiangella mangrovi]|uniref:Uncharacterized protein n=1 Tax=Jiangella mangrovi TaxID=1524084 RepID=A0A7W9GM03_9ACTN|nr:hypothetical protein [Jiangella mangrovi]MBB5786318.1 hypothetical protein [Jiangella mangrovi]
MSDSLDDSLSRRLSSLETDLAGISLAGPAAARRRAAQRTRHQVTGGVLAGVAAIAAGVFAISPPDFVASPEPVGPVTDSPTTEETSPTTPPSTPPAEPTPDPSENESPDGSGQNGSTGDDGTSSLAVPPGALIDLEYLIRGQESPSDWVEVPAGDSWLPCMPAAGDAAEAVAFQVDDYYRVEHIVEPAGTDAEARLAQLRDDLTACAEGGDHQLIQVWQVTGVGDETYLLAWQGPPRTEETQTYVEASLSRADGFVEIVIRGGAGQDYNGVPQTNDAVEAVSRLCAVSNTECPSEPEREQLYPEPVGDVPGWLALDDLAEVGLDILARGSDVTDSTELGLTDYGFVGLERDPFADDAESLEQRTYDDPLEPGGVQLTQFRAQFPDTESARAHYDALTAAAEQPSQPGDTVENTGTVSGDGYDGTTWQLTNTEFGTSWLYGAAVSGDVVTVVYYGLIADELSPDQMRQLLELAAQRIGG